MEKIKSGRVTTSKVVEVTWLDAKAGQREDVQKLKDSKNLEEFLAPTHSIGRILLCDNDTLILINEECDGDTVDYNSIPIEWIKEIHTYTRDRKCYNGIPKRLHKYLRNR